MKKFNVEPPPEVVARYNTGKQAPINTRIRSLRDWTNGFLNLGLRDRSGWTGVNYVELLLFQNIMQNMYMGYAYM